jgi:hypothetical protein
LDKGTATPAERAALVAALLVVLGGMRKAGMVGDVVTVLEGPCSEALRGAELRPPSELTPLVTVVVASLKG